MYVLPTSLVEALWACWTGVSKELTGAVARPHQALTGVGSSLPAKVPGRRLVRMGGVGYQGSMATAQDPLLFAGGKLGLFWPGCWA